LVYKSLLEVPSALTAIKRFN